MTARVSMLLKSRASLTCFRACFLPGRGKDLSAPRYFPLKQYHNFAIHAYIPATPPSLINCSTRRRASRMTQRAHAAMGSMDGGMSQPQMKIATFISNTGVLISPKPDQEGNKLERIPGTRAVIKFPPPPPPHNTNLFHPFSFFFFFSHKILLF